VAHLVGSGRNLRTLYNKADAIDRLDGCLAYESYHKVIQSFADHYGFPFEATLATFVALSPSNDYFGNLRSLASVLQGVKAGHTAEDITVSTWNHCRNRAVLYAEAKRDFLSTVRGLKIRSFYMNILDPTDPKPVTVDGHISAAWQGRDDLTMKEALVRPTHYEVIAADVRRLAKQEGLLPNQMQAILWLTRKRVLRIKFDAQFDFFTNAILVTPDDAKPYEKHK
jgi:hypothetical protein